MELSSDGLRCQNTLFVEACCCNISGKHLRSLFLAQLNISFYFSKKININKFSPAELNLNTRGKLWLSLLIWLSISNTRINHRREKQHIYEYIKLKQIISKSAVKNDGQIFFVLRCLCLLGCKKSARSKKKLNKTKKMILRVFSMNICVISYNILWLFDVCTCVHLFLCCWFGFVCLYDDDLKKVELCSF